MILGIQICSNLEWKSVKRYLAIEPAKLQRQPFGEYFQCSINSHEVIFYQSGDAKTKAAAACQYVIDRWHPDAIVNLGTCGGVSNKIRQLDVILANRTVHYDCDIRFGPKPKGFYRSMTTSLNLSWVDAKNVTHKLHRGTIGTADRDLDHRNREKLMEKKIVGADWESGAISKVCKLNGVNCLILRGVSDIPKKHELPGRDIQDINYQKNTPKIMAVLVDILNQISFR